MTLQDCVKFLTENDYLFGLNNLPYLSRKFYREVAEKDIGLSIVERKDVVVTEHAVKPKKTVTLKDATIMDAATVNFRAVYTQLIIDAEIPRTAHASKGTPYQINMSTKPGMEAFKAALLEGHSYDSLVDKAKRYYSTTQMPVKVENFFKNEIWRNEFDNDGDSFATGGALG